MASGAFFSISNHIETQAQEAASQAASLQSKERLCFTAHVKSST